jgi:two-component system response regulator GlrR
MDHFLAQAAPGARFTFSANAMEALLLHEWPMNVRQLKTTCARLALAHPAGGLLRTSDIAAVLGRTDAPAGLAEPESAGAAGPSRAELFELLREHRGNVVKLAAHYGKDRRQVYRWLERHHLDPGDFRTGLP